MKFYVTDRLNDLTKVTSVYAIFQNDKRAIDHWHFCQGKGGGRRGFVNFFGTVLHTTQTRAHTHARNFYLCYHAENAYATLKRFRDATFFLPNGTLLFYSHTVSRIYSLFFTRRFVQLPIYIRYCFLAI